LALLCRAENSIIKRLIKFGVKHPSDYISFHSLRNHSALNGYPITELIYVHSKLMIVDDKTVIVGSANLNDRSLLGSRDSEIALIITDESFVDGRMNGETYPCGVFTGRLRKNLFREHLGLAATSHVDITDPIIDSFYKKVWLKVSKSNTQIFNEVFKCIPCDAVRTFVSLKMYNKEPPLSRNDPDAAEEQLKNIQGFLVDMPLNFLADEILTPPATSKESMLGMDLWV